MNVFIEYASGYTSTMGYAPEHKDDVIRFYKDMIGSRRMVGRITITMDNGEVINL